MAYYKKPTTTETQDFKTMTDREKLTELFGKLDPSIYNDENYLRKKSITACGRRYTFNDAGELIKIQECIGETKSGNKKYVTLGVSDD